MDNKKLEMASIFGIEMRKFKKKFSLVGLILSVPALSILVPFYVFGIDWSKDTFIWSLLGSNDDLLVYVIIAPVLTLVFSIVYYKSRETIYKAWLYTSAAALVLLIGILMMYIIDPPGSAGVVSLAGLEFALLGILYTSISVIIWLYGVVTRKRDKNNT